MNIAAEGIQKRFGSTVLFDRISFSLTSGDCLAVTGKNGTGKTTLLRCLARNLLLDEGRMLVGNDLYDSKKHLKFFSYLNCEEGSYLPHLSFEENVRFYLALRELSAAEVDAGLGFLERFFPWRQFSKARIDSLSRGGQQLFFLVRCLADLNAEVFLLDEPFTHLDVDRSAGLANCLKELFLTKKSAVLTLQEGQTGLLHSLPHRLLQLTHSPP